MLEIATAYGRAMTNLIHCCVKPISIITNFVGNGWRAVPDNCVFGEMFSPLIFMGGFYAVSLVVMAALDWLVWELCVMMYPERFWDKSNAAFKCANCTDKLGTP